MGSDNLNKLYEVHLLTDGARTLIFATAAATDQAAADYAKGKMLRHACDSAEVWCGMKLVRRL
jgi:hypothetical protein